MIHSDKKILEEIHIKNIVIEPINRKNLVTEFPVESMIFKNYK